MKMKKIKKFILKGLPVFLAVLFILQIVPRPFYAAAGARLVFVERVSEHLGRAPRAADCLPQYVRL